MYKIFFDGAAQPNPGRSSYGFVVLKNNRTIHKQCGFLGTQSNNFAEFSALYFALKWLAKHHITDPVIVCGDSSLVIKIVNGEWGCKAGNLKDLHDECFKLKQTLNVTFKWVPRKQNSHANRLSQTGQRVKSIIHIID